jgi:hypothetical protein
LHGSAARRVSDPKGASLLMDLATFFAEYGIILLLGALLVFMFWSSRRRMQKQKLEQ